MKPLLLMSAWLLLAVPNHAQAYGAGYGIGNLGSLDFQYRISTLQIKNAMQAGSTQGTASAMVTAKRSAGAAAADLASNYPASDRDRARQLFETLLTKYAAVERQFSIAPGDFGGALAAFVAGNLMALRQQPFPDADFAALVRQMRAVIAANPAIGRVDAQEQRRAFEQLAIIGMFMAGTQMALAQKPDPALQERTAAAARQYLSMVIPGDIDGLVVTRTGLGLR